MKYTDPDGNFALTSYAISVTAGAVIGGFMNLVHEQYLGNVNSFKDGLIAFGKGAWIGGSATAKGGNPLSGVIAVASTFLPTYDIKLGEGFSLTLSPSIFFGSDGFNIGASLSFNIRVGGFTVRNGFSVSEFGNNFAQGGAAAMQGLEVRSSFAFGYQDENFTALLGTNYFESGISSQQTGILELGFKGFNFRLENDGSPFDDLGLAEMKNGHTASDSYRTAAISVSYEGFEVQTRLFTGYRDMKNKVKTLKGQEYSKNGWVGNPEINDYRAGILTVGYQGFNVGVNDDRVRHAVQNRFAHGRLSPQAYIPRIPLNKFYMDYKPRNQFTHW